MVLKSNTFFLCPDALFTFHFFGRMKHNANLTLVGPSCVLVPYRREHVEVYHGWMCDPGLREATASEPLSLEEEFQMCKSWSDDETKCTFIVCDLERKMVGDVNLYWNDHDDEHIAEVEIMIAETSARRKGIATEALFMVMGYAVKEHGVDKFVAKIGFDNEASQKLFRKMQFKETSSSSVFREKTMTLEGGDANAEAMQAIENVLATVIREAYDVWGGGW